MSTHCPVLDLPSQFRKALSWGGLHYAGHSARIRSVEDHTIVQISADTDFAPYWYYFASINNYFAAG